jgi:ABC-type amino acid transport substrate-binding protein
MQKWMLGLAVKAGNDDLAKALEIAMSKLLADGTVTRIMQHYGVTDRQP